jgi:hypothetical protein
MHAPPSRLALGPPWPCLHTASLAPARPQACTSSRPATMLRTLVAAAAAVSSAVAANAWSVIASSVGTASTGITFNA